MKKIKTEKLLLLGALCVLGVNIFSAAGQEIPIAFEALSEDLIVRAVELRQQALTESRAYELLAALTSEVGPRPAGSPNDRRAVEWAQKKLDRSQVEGKIVFVNTSMPRTRDGSGYGVSAPIRRHAPQFAADLGATAVLIRSVATSRNLAHTGTTFYHDSIPFIPAAALSNRDADLLSARIQSGETVRFRLELGCRFFPDARSANVIGEIPGRERPEEIVLLAAHLDSWDLGTGALDDGAGCAIVIEAARLIGTLDPAPRRTIRVFLAANEEYGVSGGVAYAQRYREDAKLHVAAMEADFGAGRVFRLLSRVESRTLPAVRELGRLLAPLGIEYGSDGTLGGTDLLPMILHRIPLFELRQDATDYFDHYHSAGDTIDKADAEDLAQVVAAFAVTALVAAEHENGFGRAPRFWGLMPEPFQQLAEEREWISPARIEHWVEPFGYTDEEMVSIEVADFGYPWMVVIIGDRALKLPFDTGNMVGLSLSTEEFDKLGLEAIDHYVRRSSDGQVSARLRVGEASSVIFPDPEPRAARIFELDHPSLPGLVGPDIFGKGHFTLDYRSGKLAASHRALPEKIPGFRTVPLVRSHRHPALILVHGSIEGRDVVIELDTGKSRTVINPTLAAELSLEKNSRGVAIENLRIGDLCFSIPSAKEVDQSGIDPDLHDPILAGIGSDLLSRFTWTVDYDKGVLWIPISR